jgi:HSP20 family protein
METQTQQHPTNGQTAEQPAPARNGHNSGGHYLRPPANITETESGFVVQVEMPGVKKDAVEITFENGELTLVGHRTPFETKAELIHRETHQLDYRRVFEVDSSIDTAHIGASFEQGILTLNLPKAEVAKPRKIEISGLN